MHRLLLIPSIVVLTLLGGAASSGKLANLLTLLLVFGAAPRILLAPAIAMDRAIGPWALVKATWRATSGQYWRLIGFFLLFLAASLIVAMAAASVVGTLATLALGPAEPMTVARLIVALASGLVQGVVASVYAAMIGRIVAQLPDRVDQRHLRGAVARQDVGEARVDEGFNLAPDGDEAGAAIGAQRGGVVEAAGVDMDAARAVAPGAGNRFGKQPAPVALPGISGDQTDKAQLARPRDAAVEFEHADRRVAVTHFEDFHCRMIDDRAQRRVAQDQPRKPQPRRSDGAKQDAVLSRSGMNAVKRERRRGDRHTGRAFAHFEIGDDRGELARGNVGQAHAQRASGGRLIRIASILPPVLSPNSVPRSYSRLNST